MLAEKRTGPVPLPAGALVVLAFIGAVPAIAGSPAAFTEEAVARGIDYTVPFTFSQYGCGVAFVDLDGDLDPDVVVSGRTDGVVGVYENDGTGHFIDRSAGSGIPFYAIPSSTTAADYDRDGDLDLLFGNYRLPNIFVRNDGNFQFTDVSTDSGLDDDGAAMGCAWGDVNGDGWLDLFVPNRTGDSGNFAPNRMYLNAKNGTFLEVGETLGIDRSMDPTLVVTFLDYDRDGDADLYLGNDKGTGPDLQNHLFRNDGGALFTDVTAFSGTEANVDCMGIAVGDLTHNGWPDLYVTNTPPGNVLLLSQGDGTFVNETAAAEVGSYGVGWATMFFDYDNDTFLDLFVCNTSNWPNRLYAYDGSWPMVDLAPVLGLDDTTPSFCAAAGDIDGDGDLDLLVHSVDAKIRLYVNNEGQTRNWMRLDVRGENGSRWAIGAQIDVRTGTLTQMREVRAGTSYKSQDELVAHFGLDAALVADEVVVTWPTSQTTRTLTALPAGQRWTLYPPDALGDADHDGALAVEDLEALIACFGPLAPGCEMMDFDGDADVDRDDVDGFVAVSGGPLVDCNGNGIDDPIDILDETSVDLDGTGVPDECECRTDFDGSGDTGFTDLTVLLQNWGPCAAPPAACDHDLDGSGDVGFGDLTELLSEWGPCP